MNEMLSLLRPSREKYLEISAKMEDPEVISSPVYPELIKEIYSDQLPEFMKADQPASPPKKIVGNELIERFIDNMFIYFDNPDLMDAELSKLKMKELIMILLKSNYFEGVVEFFQDMFSKHKNGLRLSVENNIFSEIN